MAQASQVLSSNANLLKAKASKHAIYGVLIAFLAIVIATLGIALTQSGRLTLDAIIEAQRTQVTLWILDLMPFVFAF